MPLTTNDFDYELPEALIAQFPPAERGASRLLHIGGGHIEDRLFAQLPDLLRAGDLLIFNDTRVIKARLFGAKSSGGRIEILIERILSEHEALAQIRASKPPRAGTKLILDPGITVEVLAREADLYRLRFADDRDVLSVLEQFGEVPLPPYVAHKPNAADEARYQTVYAQTPGAVAAPTAGLHFEAAMLSRLESHDIALAWLTLHVGAGTFQPVRVDRIEEHRMHTEHYSIPQATCQAILDARARGGRIVAVGTTSLRALESAAAGSTGQQGEVRAGAADTRLFITPGYRFQVVDCLITNFHLPRSTLLMLVSAFAGVETIRRAYAHAIAARYRFFSYGDAMLIDRHPDRTPAL